MFLFFILGAALSQCGEYSRQIAAAESQRNAILEKKTLCVLHHFLALEWPEIQVSYCSICFVDLFVFY